MCSSHGMNTIMLTLALSKKIILIPSNSFSLLKMSCATLTKSSNYWRQSVFSRSSTIWRFLSEIVLLLPNTDRLQQFEDLQIFVRGCSTSTKYWLPSTIWRFLSEVVLSLPNTDLLQQFEDLKIFVRGCSTSTKYWPPSTIWRFLSEVVLSLPNTDRLQQFEDLKIFVRGCSTSTTISDKNLQIVERCQYLVEVEQPLTKIFKLLKEVSIW
jgi:hypothetical protein